MTGGLQASLRFLLLNHARCEKKLKLQQVKTFSDLLLVITACMSFLLLSALSSELVEPKLLINYRAIITLDKQKH